MGFVVGLTVQVRNGGVGGRCSRVEGEVAMMAVRKFSMAEDLISRKKKNLDLEIVSVDKEVAFILELIDAGKIELAMGRYSEMRANELLPTTYTFNKLIAALGRKYAMREAEVLFEDMIDSDVSPDFVTCSQMLSKYSEVADIDNMEKMYERMKQLEIMPNTVIFRLLLEAYFSVQDYSTAETIYREINECHVEPDIHLFYKIMRLQNYVDKPDQVVETYSTLRQRKIKPTYEIYLALVEAYTKLGRYKKAMELIKVMRKRGKNPGEEPFALLSKEYARLGDAKALDHLFYMIRRFRFATATALTYNHLIEGHGKAFGIAAAEEKLEDMLAEEIEPNSDTLRVMLRLYDEYDELDNVKVVIERMSRLGVTPNRDCTWEAVQIYANRGHKEEALNNLRELVSKGIPLHDEAYASIIRMFCSEGNIELAEETINSWKAESFKLGGASFRELLSAYSERGDINRVMEILDSMKAERVRISTRTYASALYALINAGMESEIFQILTKLRERGTRPTGWLFSTLVRVSCEQGKLVKAKKIVMEMERCGLKIGAATYYHFFQSFISKQEPDLVIETLQHMQAKGEWPSKSIISSLTTATKSNPDLFRPALAEAAKILRKRDIINTGDIREDRAISTNTDINDAYSYIIATAIAAIQKDRIAPVSS
uniref:PROP1-like PPR domain-containing protein n=1 Tax=Rhodosorus marinus TaxID=101924 RepID=A0A7S3A3T1_9RHOD|mmetsp:Transcript_41456/g.163211  ORF Transcript_41456/g.163211 Transcript_41456/m.163211 type:complete len:659 (+) Transcript_41456:90-2066(+)